MLNNLWRRLRGALQPELLQPDRPATADPQTLRVLLLIFNPQIASRGGQLLNRVFGWHDPDDLARRYADDLRLASGGLANYQIVARELVDDLPQKRDGFRYEREAFVAAWQRRSGFHQPDEADYAAIVRHYRLAERIEQGEFDEIWMFGPPYAGFYESRMVGPGAFWCNAPELPWNCAHRFVIMGFNYERDVDCMLENFGHRVESIMSYVYRNHAGERNQWVRFTRYEQSAPGRAECGNVHFAPSSERDYDWGNRRVVASGADRWYQYPDLSAPARPMACDEWGGGEMRAHHLWWLDHLPRVAGSHDGVLNNWWAYCLDPNRAG